VNTEKISAYFSITYDIKCQSQENITKLKQPKWLNIIFVFELAMCVYRSSLRGSLLEALRGNPEKTASHWIASLRSQRRGRTGARCILLGFQEAG
jgi:hypothetical protein